jgi:hypothetical protein
MGGRKGLFRAPPAGGEVTQVQRSTVSSKYHRGHRAQQSHLLTPNMDC